MFSKFSKRFYATKISNHLINDISTIGPYHEEARWIVNMIDNPLTADEKDGHSGFSYVYTKTITDIINTHNYTNWKNNYIHLSYDDMFTLFYQGGFQYLGTKLITTPFDGKLLEEFNKNQKLNNYKLRDNQQVVQLKVFTKKLMEIYPELKE